MFHTMTIHNPSHPGPLIKSAHLDPFNISGRAFARHLGVGYSTVSRLLSGKSGITPEMAIRLSLVFDHTAPEFWLNLQHDYDLWQLDRPKNRKLFAGIKRIKFDAGVEDNG